MTARALSAGWGSLRVNRSPLVRTLVALAAVSAAVALAGCNTNGLLPLNERAGQPLSEKMVAEIESKNMDRDAPILVRLFKEESELEVWKQDRTGRFALLKTYPICRWSGELGPKIKEGDRQAPEGFYTITPGQMNPNSQYYLSFDLGFPNAYDRANGRTGSLLMVHGDCSSRGCYSMTDEQIAEIYALGRDAFFGGQQAFQLQAYPFRMTPTNLAKHRTNPHMAFWKMLKVGSDHFEVSGLEPKVNVCEKRYVFDAEPPAGSTRPLSFNPTGKCPAFEVPEEIASAVREKQRQDNIQFAELIRRGTPVAPVRTYADGGMHPVFVAAVKRNAVGVKPAPLSLVSTPGTIPATVQPPRIPELADAPITAAATHGATAMAEQAPEPAQPAAVSGNLFGGLFATGSAKTSSNNDETPLDRMARFMGLRSADAAPSAREVVPTPRPKPATRAAHATPTAPAAPHGAIRAKSQGFVASKSAAASQNPTPTPAAPAAPAPAQTAAAQPAATPSATSLNGAAPVVPAGTFESRWSAFR
jgi:murein L,D-transpeptidase YafK